MHLVRDSFAHVIKPDSANAGSQTRLPPTRIPRRLERIPFPGKRLDRVRHVGHVDLEIRQARLEIGACLQRCTDEVLVLVEDVPSVRHIKGPGRRSQRAHLTIALQDYRDDRSCCRGGAPWQRGRGVATSRPGGVEAAGVPAGAAETHRRREGWRFACDAVSCRFRAFSDSVSRRPLWVVYSHTEDQRRRDKPRRYVDSECGLACISITCVCEK